MKSSGIVLVCLIALEFALAQPASAQVPAFPGAEGYGAMALSTCDRSDVQVLKVINLNDSGPGSFRQALAEVQSDRLSVIVFSVAGVIKIDGNLEMSKQCLYIAGQTAPGSGITLNISGNFYWRSTARNVVMRYLRLAGGANHLVMASNGDFIIDHVSSRWSLNTLMTVTSYLDSSASRLPVKNITIQRSLFSEALAVHPTANIISSNCCAYEDTWRKPTVYNIDLHHSLYVSNSHRNPSAATGGTKIINNVVYNWNQHASEGTALAVTDFIANFYKLGPRNDLKPARQTEITWDCASPVNKPVPPDASGYASYYVAKNIGPHNTDPDADNWAVGPPRMVGCFSSYTGTDGSTGTVGSPIPAGNILHANLAEFETPRRNSPLPGPTHAYPIDTQSADDAYASIVTAGDVGANARLDCDGDWISNSDAVDRRVISDVKNGTGPDFIPASPDEVGGWPAVIPGPGCKNTSGDGIPDAYKRRYGLDINKWYANVDLNGDGYTLLEAFLNGTRPR